MQVEEEDKEAVPALLSQKLNACGNTSISEMGARIKFVKTI